MPAQRHHAPPRLPLLAQWQATNYGGLGDTSNDDPATARKLLQVNGLIVGWAGIGQAGCWLGPIPAVSARHCWCQRASNPAFLPASRWPLLSQPNPLYPQPPHPPLPLSL